MNILNKLKDKVVETVGQGLGLSLPPDERLQGHKEKLSQLKDMVTQLQGNFAKYADAMMETSKCACTIAKDTAQFYQRSPARLKSVQQFADANFTFDSQMYAVFKEEFGWEILKVFDDWIAEIQKVKANIKVTEETRAKLSALQQKVKAYEQRGHLQGKEELDYQDSREKLEALLKRYTSMSAAVDQAVSKIIEGRFAAFDKCYVALMEVQMRYFKEGLKMAESFQGSIDNYRNRFPRPDPKDYSTAPVSSEADHEALEDVDQHSGDQKDGKTQDRPLPVPKRGPQRPPGNPGDRQPPPKEEKEPEHDEDHEDEHSDEDKPAPKAPDSDSLKPPTSSASPPPRSASPAPPAAQAATMDIFNAFSAPQAKAAPSMNRGLSALAGAFGGASEVNLMDDFASGGTSAAAVNEPNMDAFSTANSNASSKRSTTPKAAAPPKDPLDFGFDFSGGGAAPTPSRPPSAPPQQRSSTQASGKNPARNSNNSSLGVPTSSSGQKLKSDNGFDFDPLTPKSAGPANGKQQNAAADEFDMFSSGPSKNANGGARSQSASPAPPAEAESAVISGDADPNWDGNRQPGEIRFEKKKALIFKTPEELAKEEADYQRTKKPGQTKEEWIIEKKRKETIKNMQDRDRRQAEEKAAMDDATWKLEDHLKNWEYKNGVQKNLRNLLSSIDTIAWSGSGWQKIGLADLMDRNNMKKHYRTAQKLFHPDKHSSSPPEQKVIAEHIFEAVNSAWKKFEENPNM